MRTKRALTWIEKVHLRLSRWPHPNLDPKPADPHTDSPGPASPALASRNDPPELISTPTHPARPHLPWRHATARPNLYPPGPPH